MPVSRPENTSDRQEEAATSPTETREKSFEGSARYMGVEGDAMVSPCQPIGSTGADPSTVSNDKPSAGLLPADSSRPDAAHSVPPSPVDQGNHDEHAGTVPSTEEAIQATDEGDRDPCADASALDPELDRLRTLLFSGELKRLARLEKKLGNKEYTIRKVSNVIAEAVLLRSQHDERLNAALEPVIETILTSSLRRQHTELVSALFPLMGPSIRKSIAESFRSMMENFSKSLEMAFSLRGLRWRIEAFTTGKSFSEVVMLHTVVYRVEQIFLIHTDTGLVLQHLQNEGVGAMDADMVSAMLTAIQDFAIDCFASGTDSLQSLRMGEFTILLEKSRKAYIACVIRGNPPPSFSSDIRFALELISVQFSDQLQDYNGDSSEFIGAVRHLEPLMVSRFQEEKKLPFWARIVPVFLIYCLFFVGIGYLYKRYADTQERERTQHEFKTAMHAATTLLRKEPGILVEFVHEAPTIPWEVRIMRDPLARKPQEILRDGPTPVSNFSITEVPYVAYDTEIVRRRIESSLHPPKTVSISLSPTGTLTLEGTAPLNWIGEALDKSYSLPGVNQVDVSGIRDPRLQEMSDLKNTIESTTVRFPLGSSTPDANEMAVLKKTVESIARLETLAKETGLLLSLTIYGHADTSGTPKKNYEISEARTRLVAALLYEKGSSVPVSMYGMGADYPQNSGDQHGNDKASRRIELRVHLMRIAKTDSRLFAE